MKWIELKEGNPLPDYDVPVLWIFEDATMTVDSLDKDGNPWLFGGSLDEGGWRNDPSATHWMPLPPTPDAGEAIEERKFSLKDIIEVYEDDGNDCKCDYCAKVQKRYFKDKFGIDI